MVRNWFTPIPPPPFPAGFEPLAIESRLPAFDGGPADAVRRLREAVVAVIGLGSVGRVMAEQLARAGIGTLQLIDRNRIKSASLITHCGVLPADIGQPKAHSAGALCKTLRPDTNVQVFDGAIENLPPAALLDTDLVLLASDNLAAENAAGQLCTALTKPMVQLSVDGPTMVAQARVFRCDHPGGPCPRCLFGELEEQQLRGGQHFPCDGGDAVTPPTMSTSSLCALAGSIGASLALRHLLQLGAPLTDGVHEWCGFTCESWSGPIRRREDCPNEHRPWVIVRPGRALAGMSLREIADAAGVTWSSAPQFEVDDFVMADPGGERFLCDDGSLPRVFSRRLVPAHLLQALADQPLAKIAPAAPRWVKVVDQTRTCLLANRRTEER
jgi:molybdopterin/thiamine biosynthesis adenylyltransferase